MVLHLPGCKIALDRHEDGTDMNFVSHAHSDHISGLKKRKSAIMSEATMALLHAKGKKAELLQPPSGVRLLNAGHMLGSRQIYAECDASGSSVIYSGDYQMMRSYTAEPIETKHADVLIIDSTYPDPLVEFDDREEVVSAIQTYSRYKVDRGTVLFGAYSTGKAQELVKILNESGTTPFVDSKIARMNEVYGSFGVKLDYQTLSESGEVPKANFVGVVSMHDLIDWKIRVASNGWRRAYTAIASGFAKSMTFNTDVQFGLSDHADFRQAVEYIGLCSPKRIYTVGSGAAVFAKNLESSGYAAEPLQVMAAGKLAQTDCRQV